MSDIKHAHLCNSPLCASSTVLQVEEHLKDKKLNIDRDVNAMLMDKYGRQVGLVMKEAKKAKKTLRLKLRKMDMNLDLAAATEAFMMQKKSKQRKAKDKPEVARENIDFWQTLGDSDKENEGA